MAHSFFADSSLFWSICALLSHHGFCCTSLVSASLAILRIALSTHRPCFTIACCLLTSRVLPLLFSPHTYSILWLTIAHVRSSLFWSASFHHWRLWLWFFLYSLFSGVASCERRVPPAPLFGIVQQRGPLVVPPHHCETLCHGVIAGPRYALQHQPLRSTMPRRDQPAPLCDT